MDGISIYPRHGPTMSKRIGSPSMENTAPAAVLMSWPYVFRNVRSSKKQRNSMASQLGCYRRLAMVNKLVLVAVSTVASLSLSLSLYGQPMSIQHHEAIIHDKLMKTGADIIHDKLMKIGADSVWLDLLEERSSGNGNANDAMNMIVLEVGMHSARQTIQAAGMGYTVHGVEPSPRNFERVQTQLKQEAIEIQHRVHLHHRAAGSDSTTRLDFSSSGGTGDHVGEFDVWNMKPGIANDPKLRAKQGTLVQVQSLRLDDLILGDGTKTDKSKIFYLAKIDTQGFEPVVFSGLTESLKQHKLQFVLTEFWPAGMDLMMGAVPERACQAGTNLLQLLVDSGYMLYALHPTTHPRAPATARSFLGAGYQRESPLDDLHAYCDFFYEMARRFPSQDDYRMGYWADLLAVAPQAANLLPGKTPLGKILKGESMA